MKVHIYTSNMSFPRLNAPAGDKKERLAAVAQRKGPARRRGPGGPRAAETQTSLKACGWCGSEAKLHFQTFRK